MSRDELSASCFAGVSVGSFGVGSGFGYLLELLRKKEKRADAGRSAYRPPSRKRRLRASVPLRRGSVHWTRTHARYKEMKKSSVSKVGNSCTFFSCPSWFFFLYFSPFVPYPKVSDKRSAPNTGSRREMQAWRSRQGIVNILRGSSSPGL